MDISKKKLLEALEKSLGVVTTACKASGIPRSSHYVWLAKDKKYKAAVEELQGVAIDFVESKLFKLIEGGSDAATIFYLKTKGKVRGYVERQQFEHTFEQPVFGDDSEASNG